MLDTLEADTKITQGEKIKQLKRIILFSKLHASQNIIAESVLNVNSKNKIWQNMDLLT